MHMRGGSRPRSCAPWRAHNVRWQRQNVRSCILPGGAPGQQRYLRCCACFAATCLWYTLAKWGSTVQFGRST